MTWGWTVKGDSLGTPAESAVKASWPDYNAEYLQKKLEQGDRRYNGRYGPGPLGSAGSALDDTQRGVYLTEAIKGYEGEAEACLKAEFEQWLQGIHPENALAEDNEPASYYRNDLAESDGGPKRRHVYDGAVSTEMRDYGQYGTGWQATRWGTKQLTNLEGVRDFLRAGKIAKDNAERDMNILAERGPQDLNEAWMYFKHWVKRRPVSTCDEKGPPGYNSKALTALGVERINGTGPTLSLARSTGAGDNMGARDIRAVPPAPTPEPPTPPVTDSSPGPSNWYEAAGIELGDFEGAEGQLDAELGVAQLDADEAMEAARQLLSRPQTMQARAEDQIARIQPPVFAPTPQPSAPPLSFQLAGQLA